MTITAEKPRRRLMTANNGHSRSVPLDWPAPDCHPVDRREDPSLEGIVSCSSQMEEVFQIVQQAAPAESTVLVTGESGTGKELIAEAIHRKSPRADGPFVAVNWAAVPESLVESELFGHVKGSFTGATADRMGRFEAAEDGTIFIDEIGDLHPESQATLLRVLESRVVTPVGGNDEREVNVRVVAASNRPLEKMVAGGEFREELYYRLNVVRVSLPPLRERDGDVRLLMQHFVKDFCRTYQRPLLDVDEDLMTFLDSHRLPGNVREIRNCAESMVVMSDSDRLTLDDVPPMLRTRARPSPDHFDVPDDLNLAELEQVAIKQTLHRFQGNRTRTAEKLGISVRTLQRKLARWKKEAT